MSKIPKAVAAYLKAIGKKGGAAGRGQAKRRDSAFYARIGKLSAAAKKLKKEIKEIA